MLVELIEQEIETPEVPEETVEIPDVPEVPEKPETPEYLLKMVDVARDKKYTEFETAIRKELKSRISNNPEVQEYKSAYDNIQHMKSLYKQIQDSGTKKI